VNMLFRLLIASSECIERFLHLEQRAQMTNMSQEAGAVEQKKSEF
jgi:hypothetical protein